MYLRRLKTSEASFGKYALAERDASGRQRPVAPSILVGNPETFDRVCRDLMAPIHAYDSFVLSFKESARDLPETMIHRTVEEFEMMLFGGLTKADYARCAVFHERSRGCDIHYAVGRTNLRTGQTTEFYNISSSDPALFAKFGQGFSLRHGLSDPYDPPMVNLTSPTPKGKANEPGSVWQHFDQAAAAYYQSGDATNRDELIAAFRRDGHLAQASGKTSIVINHGNQTYHFTGAKYSIGFEYITPTNPIGYGPGVGGESIRVADADASRLSRVEATLAELTRQRSERQQASYGHAALSWRPIPKGGRVRQRKCSVEPPTRCCVRFATGGIDAVDSADRGPGVLTPATMGGALPSFGAGDVASSEPRCPPDLGERYVGLSPSSPRGGQNLSGPLAADRGGTDDRGAVEYAPPVDRGNAVNSYTDPLRLFYRGGSVLAREKSRREPMALVFSHTYHDEPERFVTKPRERRRLTHANMGLNFISQIYAKIHRHVHESKLRLGEFIARAVTIAADCYRELEQIGCRLAECNHAVAAGMAGFGGAGYRARKELSFAELDRAGTSGNEAVLHGNTAERIDPGSGDGREPELTTGSTLARKDFARVTASLSRINADLRSQPLTRRHPAVPVARELEMEIR